MVPTASTRAVGMRKVGSSLSPLPPLPCREGKDLPPAPPEGRGVKNVRRGCSDVMSGHLFFLHTTPPCGSQERKGILIGVSRGLLMALIGCKGASRSMWMGLLYGTGEASAAYRRGFRSIQKVLP